MIPLLILVLPAVASPRLVGLGDTLELGSRGNWARIYDRPGGGYWYLAAGGGDYRVQELDDDYAFVSTAYVGLTGRTDLVDHAFAPCPDGGFAHVGSGSLDEADDSAWLFRYDADLELVSSATIVERDTTLTTNDAPLLCGEDWTLTAFQPDDLGAGPLYLHDADGDLLASLSFDADPAIGGSSMVLEPDGTLAWVRAYSLSDTIQIERYAVPDDLASATELEHLGTEEIFLELLLGENLVAYWPQATLRVGGYYVVAHLGQGLGEDWITDTGDVWLQVFDSDWTWVEGLKLTDFGGGDGASQTFLHWREGSEVLQVLYSVDVQPTLTEVLLDLDALGVETAGDGGASDGGGEDGGAADGGASDGGASDGGASDGGGTDGGAADGGAADGGAADGGADDGGADDGGADDGGSEESTDKGCAQVPGGASLLLGLLGLLGLRRRC